MKVVILILFLLWVVALIYFVLNLPKKTNTVEKIEVKTVQVKEPKPKMYLCNSASPTDCFEFNADKNGMTEYCFSGRCVTIYVEAQ